MLKLAIVLYSIAVSVAQFYSQPSMGGSMGCVVTGNKLFSQGNFIRDLSSAEHDELLQYKKEIADFNTKIANMIGNADSIVKRNDTIPPMPMRPPMPTFCTGPDTTLYIFPGCVVQNNKVYVGHTFARELSVEERQNLDEFAKRMAQESAKSSSVTVDPVSSTTVSSAAEYGKTLDFCTEI